MPTNNLRIVASSSHCRWSSSLSSSSIVPIIPHHPPICQGRLGTEQKYAVSREAAFFEKKGGSARGSNSSNNESLGERGLEPVVKSFIGGTLSGSHLGRQSHIGGAT